MTPVRSTAESPPAVDETSARAAAPAVVVDLDQEPAPKVRVALPASPVGSNPPPKPASPARVLMVEASSVRPQQPDAATQRPKTASDGLPEEPPLPDASGFLNTEENKPSA